MTYALKSSSLSLLHGFTTFLPGNGYSTNTKKVQKDARPFLMRFFSEMHLGNSYCWPVMVRPVSMHTSNYV